jgi:hypothetical protein
MTNKKFWLGMLVIALVFGMTVVGCSSGGGGVDSALDGTWVSGGGYWQLKLDDGDYEEGSIIGGDFQPMYRGTYSADDGEYESEITEINGEYLDDRFEPRWYDYDEYLEIMEPYITESDYELVRTTYVIVDNTLTFTYYYEHKQGSGSYTSTSVYTR